MPTYEYVCRDCNEPLEIVQSFSDEALTVCPHCGGALRKVFGNVGIVFKGSGFYKTDSRSSSVATRAPGGESSTNGGSDSVKAPPDTATPAATPPSAPSESSSNASGTASTAGAASPSGASSPSSTPA